LGLIKKNEEILYPTFFANTENKKYKFYKKPSDFKINRKSSSLIMLFGSCAKATSGFHKKCFVFINNKKLLKKDLFSPLRSENT